MQFAHVSEVRATAYPRARSLTLHAGGIEMQKIIPIQKINEAY